MKKAIYCILFGVMSSVLSCSVIKMTRSNVQATKAPTMQRDENLITPNVPALVVLPITNQAQHNRSDFKPFRDSLINGLRFIQESVNKGNSKLDSSLANQNTILLKQNDLIGILKAQQYTISKLQFDTARLYQKSKITTEIKKDADFGNTFKAFAVNVLFSIALGISLILITNYYYYNRLTKRISKHNVA